MNTQEKSDTSLAFCMHCATQLMPSARVCPRCGEDPFVDTAAADPDASWFDEASVKAPNDHVLEAMMAIAAARPKVVPLATGAFLQPGPPALVREPSVAVLPQQASALAHASPLRTPSWRVVLGAGAAVSALAALTAVLWNANSISPPQRAERATGVVGASAVVSPTAEAARSDRDVSPAAGAEPPPPSAPAQASPSARPDEDARTIAAALGLGARPEPPAPAPAPRVVLPVTPAADAAGSTPTPKRCGEALAALALCREP
ncbi:zinc ribbon domain-containing protein [Variovorax sp. UMC13]|uniref:zinc ribbon domain-containing protein n=1 Tax=Variovorax sp. UMC13 TaxID=1862326 RepID=UPI0015FF4394|nr:zinc ribbon domain-containing protein [Variovorax sp. UMC13]MBB1602524.1 hypothetical protein [Variovorax sp. UMC13]